MRLGREKTVDLQRRVRLVPRETGGKDAEPCRESPKDSSPFLSYSLCVGKGRSLLGADVL